MAYTIIDRRLNGKGKSTPNRQKFIKRVKTQVREAVKDVIRKGNIEDIIDDKGKKINVPVKDLNQPTFHHGKGGVADRVFPGNKEFTQGDRIPRPTEGEGQGGREGSPDGEGNDDFEFHLTKDEFLQIFFEDLELPDLLKKNLSTIDEFAMRRAGFSTDGNPARLNIERSMRTSKARRNALRGPKKKKLKALEKEREELVSFIANAQANGQDCSIEKDRLQEVERKIKGLKRKIKAIPFVDEIDLRYNRWEKYPTPTTQAVMFCVMDVSGSMDSWRKEMAKRFFMLLYLFLTREYERVDLVFIRHHTSAKEVDEEEFFYSKETGGTLISPALELLNQIVDERYPRNEWNIYGCQASDGDNWGSDNANTYDMMVNHIMPKVQYYAYVEINNDSHVGDIWSTYEQVKGQYPTFDMAKITHVSEIYPVFRGLFEKRDAGVS